MTDSFSLIIHGGAGQFADLKTAVDEKRYLDRIGHVLERGREVLQQDGSAVQAVELCVRALEDDELFNAGRGAVLNSAGKVQMDAGIMNGADLSAGAVGAVTRVKNPIGLAERIRRQGEHVMLVGEGALEFAMSQSLPLEPEDFFIVEKSLRQFKKLQGTRRQELDHDDADICQDTVGAVARDRSGNLAAATSTGGLANKRVGRVGDSPIIGAGVYADNRTCALSATGHGEDMMRTVLAKRIADIMELLQCDLSAALEQGMQYFTERVGGRGGVIAIDHNGLCRSRYTTPRMVHGWIEHGGETVCRF